MVVVMYTHRPTHTHTHTYIRGMVSVHYTHMHHAKVIQRRLLATTVMWVEWWILSVLSRWAAATPGNDTNPNEHVALVVRQTLKQIHSQVTAGSLSNQSLIYTSICGCLCLCVCVFWRVCSNFHVLILIWHTFVRHVYVPTLSHFFVGL